MTVEPTTSSPVVVSLNGAPTTVPVDLAAQTTAENGARMVPLEATPSSQGPPLPLPTPPPRPQPISATVVLAKWEWRE